MEHLLDEALLDKLYPLECEDSTPEDPEGEDSGPDGAYRMSTYPRGPALIINNAKFEDLPDRPGTETDGKALQHLFTSSGFVTSTFNTVRSLLVACNKYSNHMQNAITQRLNAL